MKYNWHDHLVIIHFWPLAERLALVFALRQPTDVISLIHYSWSNESISRRTKNAAVLPSVHWKMFAGTKNL